MTTLNAMVDECLLKLASYGLIQPRLLQLTADIDDVETSIVLAGVDNLEAGIAELEGELVYILSIDKPNKTVEVIRGYLSTVAASHLAGAALVGNPPWPRSVVALAVNEAITSSYPDLFKVAVTTLTADPVLTTYALDPSVEMVRDVRYKLIGPSQRWVRVRNFYHDPVDSSVTIDEPVLAGQPIRVTVQARPAEISPTDQLTSSGLSASAKKYVVTQACADLVRFMDASRLPVDAAAADDMDQNRPVGAATSVLKLLLTLAQIEKQAERNRLLVKYPVPVYKAKGR